MKNSLPVLLLPVALSALLAGCDGDACPWEVTTVAPADGASDVWISDAFDEIVVSLDVAITGIRLVDADGEEREGDVTLDGSTGEWRVTNGSLFGDTTYDVLVDADSCEASVTSFTTGDHIQQELATDGVFRLDFSNAEGEGRNALLAVMDSGDFEPAFWQPEFGQWVVVPLVGNEQETCYPTTSLVPGGWDGSAVSMPHITALWGSDGVEFTLIDTDLDALASRDGSAFERARMVGQLDVSMFGCDLLEAFGATCVPCSSAPSRSCVLLDIDGITASVDTSISPVEVGAFCDD